MEVLQIAREWELSSGKHPPGHCGESVAVGDAVGRCAESVEVYAHPRTWLLRVGKIWELKKTLPAGS